MPPALCPSASVLPKLSVMCAMLLLPLLLGTVPLFLTFYLPSVGSDSSPLPFSVFFLPHHFSLQLSAAGRGTIDSLLAYFM